jgi:PKD repeat protein
MMTGLLGMNKRTDIFWIWTLILLLVIQSHEIVVLAESNQSDTNVTALVTYENGTVAAEWAVDFTASPLEGYPPLCVRFTMEGPLGEYYWDFGDGTTSNSRNPVHCYQKKGVYWVKVKYFVGQIKGELSKENYITVNDPTTFVDYKAEPSNGTAPLTTQFSITGNPTNIIWDFDDGEESTEFNPRHQYKNPGLYTPTLTYCLSGSCQKISKYNYVEVSSGEEVNFTAEKTQGIAPLSTKFVVTGPAETYSWNMGDGTSSYERDPGHFYSAAGNYTVVLTYSIDGASYTITKDNYIQVLPKYIPDFNASPRTGIAPLCVEFDMINRPQSWIWIFGDNTTSTDDHAGHCYGLNGSYTIDLQYCYNSLCNMVTKPGFITVNAPRIYTEPGDEDAVVKFRTDASEGLKYIWDFGDMTSSHGAAPIHRYEETGTFNVTLSILGTCGCTTKTNTTVKVDPKHPLDFSATPTEGCAPHYVQFSESSPEIPKTRVWDFGDGETSDEKNPFHRYLFSGVYPVSLLNVYPDHEENVTKPGFITVHAVPKPSFSVNPMSGYAPVTVTCTDTTTGYESKRYWEFGDGVTGSSARIEHRYEEEGTYNVSLTVWGEGNCHETVIQQIHVLKPVVEGYDLTGLPRRGIAPVCTSFQVTGAPYRWNVDFGDGQTSTELNPFHCYDSAGIYSPKLHACDEGGCEDVLKPAYVVAIPPSYVTLTVLPGWNLVSTPVTLEPGQDTAGIFSDVHTSCHSLFSWNSASGQWKRMTKDSPLDPLTGVWIYSDEQTEVSLPISATNPEGNLSRLLTEGWNLVSFPGIAASPVELAFPDNLSWSYLLGYDAMEQRYTDPIEKGRPSPDQMLDPRSAYWLYMASSGMFTTPAI